MENTEETQVELLNDIKNMEETQVEKWKDMENTEEKSVYPPPPPPLTEGYMPPQKR